VFVCVRARARMEKTTRVWGRGGELMEYRSEEELATLAHASGVRLLSFRRFLASIDIGRRQAFNLRFWGLFNACFLELSGGGIRTNSCCGCGRAR
jgi:hypothetical protein